LSALVSTSFSCIPDLCFMRPSFHTVTREFCVRVQNSGSTARDHLANERTFLAWSKTGLGFLGAGTGLFTAYSFNYTGENQSLSIHPMTIVPAVLLLISNGGGLLAYATYRYITVKNALCAGDFIINKTGLYSVIVSSSLSTLVALGILGYEEYKVKGNAHQFCNAFTRPS
jgi:uncharacterized membrane protein YidH (DUF202 family)